MAKTTVRKLSEVPRNVVNHAGRGDARGVPTRAELNFQREAEKKTAEQLRAEADAKLKAAHWKVLAPEVADRIDAVLARYPWYIDGIRAHGPACLCAVCKAGNKNAQAILAKLANPEAIGFRRRQHRSDNDYSLLEIAAAVEEAAAEGRLELNQAVIQKQRIEGYSEQLSGAPQTEDELYDNDRTPMHRLRTLANGNFDPLGPQ